MKRPDMRVAIPEQEMVLTHLNLGDPFFSNLGGTQRLPVLISGRSTAQHLP